MREEGYYWVRIGKPIEQSRIMEWSDGSWWNGNEECEEPESNLTVLGPLLEPPKL